MKFWKMNGAGNDFIILNNLEEKLPETAFPLLARTLCTPHLSLGADGFMVVDKAQGEADFRMLFYNSDGSVGEMCGNGARCICRYGYETGLSGPQQVIETTAGIVTGTRMDRRQYRIRLNDPTTLRLDLALEAEGRTWPCAYVELGTPGLPHAVRE
ncbi:MAG: diaminopimelate epimerase, partial [Evtepia sp.]